MMMMTMMKDDNGMVMNKNAAWKQVGRMSSFGKHHESVYDGSERERFLVLVS